MFVKLRQWSRMLLPERIQEDRLSLHDPREMPRPRRRCTSLDMAALEKSCVEESQEAKECAADGWSCFNCERLLETMTECYICLEQYQTHGIYTCLECGNLTCYQCAWRLPHCPFCRAVLPQSPRRNVALERILATLMLPCRNTRWGCKELLVERSRPAHESCCLFNPVQCPFRKLCTWRGQPDNLSTHFQQTHALTLLSGSGITVEIAAFRSKVRVSQYRARKYTVCLTCFSAIFICKISLHNMKLRLLIVEVSGRTVDGLQFAAWLEVSSSFRNMTGMLPISTHYRRNKELQIACESLLSPWRRTEDQVKIAITIQPLS